MIMSIELSFQTIPKVKIMVRRKWTTESFVNFVEEKISAGSLNLDKVVYTRMTDSVEVTCMEHGFALDTKAFDLFRGRNPCPLCGAKKMTTEQFILGSRFVHGERFDYSDTVFVKRTQKVSITCPEHGAFEQLPINHLKGHLGCPDCSGQKPISPKMFVARSKENTERIPLTILVSLVCFLKLSTPRLNSNAISMMNGLNIQRGQIYEG